MRKISENETKIANFLNQRRDKAYLDIYKETDFSGLGILVDEELVVYKYFWNISFNKDNNSFSTNNFLYRCRNKISYEDLEKIIINDVNILGQKYENNSNEMERYSEIIKLKSYIGELFNKEIYEKIKDEISNKIKEDL